MMNNFLKFMDAYSQKSKYINSEAPYYKLLKNIEEEISNICNKKFLVKSSCGQNRSSMIPWIGIFDEKITQKASHGIFIVILFKADMTGFYLALNQGMQYYLDNYGKLKYKYLEETSNYIRNKITNKKEFLSTIDLKVNKKTRGYGYELGTIIAKYYPKEHFDMLVFKEDFGKFINIYAQLVNELKEISYDEYILNILSNINLEKEKKPFIKNNISSLTLTEVAMPEKIASKKNLVKLKEPKKIDSVKKAKKDKEIGLIGEELVWKMERQKMIDYNRQDLISKMSRVYLIDDTKGYDIISYNFDENLREHKIYIEVKTTELSAKSFFYLSLNELEFMKNNQKNYWIYRVVLAKNPYFYRINYAILTKKFKLEPYIYKVKFK